MESQHFFCFICFPVDAAPTGKSSNGLLNSSSSAFCIHPHLPGQIVGKRREDRWGCLAPPQAWYFWVLLQTFWKTLNFFPVILWQFAKAELIMKQAGSGCEQQIGTDYDFFPFHLWDGRLASIPYILAKHMSWLDTTEMPLISPHHNCVTIRTGGLCTEWFGWQSAVVTWFVIFPSFLQIRNYTIVPSLDIKQFQFVKTS